MLCSTEIEPVPDPAPKSQAGPGDTVLSLPIGHSVGPSHITCCRDTSPPGLCIGVVRSMRGSRCSTVFYVLLQEDESRQGKVCADRVQRH